MHSRVVLGVTQLDYDDVEITYLRTGGEIVSQPYDGDFKVRVFCQDELE